MEINILFVLKLDIIDFDRINWTIEHDCDVIKSIFSHRVTLKCAFFQRKKKCEN